MKLIIQIPCFNEEKSLPVTTQAIPKSFRGIQEVEILVIDDGSSDRTVEVAQELNVDHIVRLTNHKGLAAGFKAGIDTCLKLGADIIVNTDADNQYYAPDIQKLIDPILDGSADIVIGDRHVEGIQHFSWIKKQLQKIGSWVVRQLSGTQVPDTTSGFRAYKKEAALRINILSDFTYTLESLIQAGKQNMAVKHVQIRTNEQLRPSRLFSNIHAYVGRSITTLTVIYTLYEPLKVFFYIGTVIFSGGVIISLRFLYFYLANQGSGHIQSLILATILLMIGFQTLMIGLLASLIGSNRRLIEDVLYRVKKIGLKDKDEQENNHPSN